jgi:hypothetical protein
MINARAINLRKKRRVEVGEIGGGHQRLLVGPVNELQQVGASGSV